MRKEIESKDISNYIRENKDISLFYLNYWAPFCAPCIEHFSVLDKISPGRSRLKIVAVCNKEECTREEALKYEGKYRISFLYETDKTDTSMFPKSLLVDKEMVVIGTMDGIADEETALDYFTGVSEINTSTLLILPRAIKMVMQSNGAF